MSQMRRAARAWPQNATENK